MLHTVRFFENSSPAAPAFTRSRRNRYAYREHSLSVHLTVQRTATL